MPNAAPSPRSAIMPVSRERLAPSRHRRRRPRRPHRCDPPGAGRAVGRRPREERDRRGPFRRGPAGDRGRVRPRRDRPGPVRAARSPGPGVDPGDGRRVLRREDAALPDRLEGAVRLVRHAGSGRGDARHDAPGGSARGRGRGPVPLAARALFRRPRRDGAADARRPRARDRVRDRRDDARPRPLRPLGRPRRVRLSLHRRRARNVRLRDRPRPRRHRPLLREGEGEAPLGRRGSRWMGRATPTPS